MLAAPAAGGADACIHSVPASMATAYVCAQRSCAQGPVTALYAASSYLRQEKEKMEAIISDKLVNNGFRHHDMRHCAIGVLLFFVVTCTSGSASSPHGSCAHSHEHAAKLTESTYPKATAMGP